MKKLILATVVCLLAAFNMQAQEGKWGIGLNLGYGTEVSKAFLGGRVLYDINDQFDVVGSFNRYFKESAGPLDLKTWDINADFHWNVIRQDMFEFYPLVGLTYLHQKLDGFGDSASDGWFGVNLGVGIMFNLNSHWSIGAEAKGQIMSDSQFVPMVSAMYRF